MTVSEAIEAIRSVGHLEATRRGTICYRLSRERGPEVETALSTLRARKAEALALLAVPPISESAVDEVTRWAAVDLLNRAGARQFFLGGVYTIGLWQDADCPELRAAIQTVHRGGAQVVHLEDRRVPDKYRQHRPPGPKGETASQAWAEWKAGMLNRLFERQGATGQPGRITAGTVRHSERKAGRGAKLNKTAMMPRADDLPGKDVK